MIALISTLVWIFSLTVDHPKKITSISTHPSPHSSFRTPVPTKLYSVKTDYKTNNRSCLYIHMPIWKIISFEPCSHALVTTKIGSLKKDYESNNHSVTNFSMSMWKILSYESYNFKEKIHILKRPITRFCPHDPEVTKRCNPKTDSKTSPHAHLHNPVSILLPPKNYIVWKQNTKQIITPLSTFICQFEK